MSPQDSRVPLLELQPHYREPLLKTLTRHRFLDKESCLLEKKHRYIILTMIVPYL